MKQFISVWFAHVAGESVNLDGTCNQSNGISSQHAQLFGIDDWVEVLRAPSSVWTKPSTGEKYAIRLFNEPNATELKNAVEKLGRVSGKRGTFFEVVMV